MIDATFKAAYLKYFCNWTKHSDSLSIIYSYIHSFIHSFIFPFIHSCFRPFIHSFIHSFIPSFLPSFVRSFVHSSIFFILSFILWSNFFHSYRLSFFTYFMCTFLFFFYNLHWWSLNRVYISWIQENPKKRGKSCEWSRDCKGSNIALTSIDTIKTSNMLTENLGTQL